MRRLVIHLGLHKTATTSLQTHYFPQFPGYLGRFYPETNYASCALDELAEVHAYGALIDGQRVFEVDGREVWIPAMESWVEELLASDEEIHLWSNEGLSLWRSPAGSSAASPVMDAPEALPRRGSHPIVGFLRHLRALLPEDVELKTVLTLRNQSDWLCSLAAQSGIAETAFVERLINADDAFLDYHAITRDLEHLRGRKNHLTLIFEEGLEQNAQKIQRFAGYTPSEIPNLDTSQARENVRRGAEGWTGQRFVGIEGALRAIARTSVLDRHVLSNRTWRRALRPILGYEMRRRLFGRYSDPQTFTISLTPSQRESIRIHCDGSNAQLSSHLGLDLKEFGY